MLMDWMTKSVVFVIFKISHPIFALKRDEGISNTEKFKIPLIALKKERGRF